jgi:hypothetical protein
LPLVLVSFRIGYADEQVRRGATGAGWPVSSSRGTKHASQHSKRYDWVTEVRVKPDICSIGCSVLGGSPKHWIADELRVARGAG